MPITLPPISRRRFLGTTLAAGAGMALGGSGCARGGGAAAASAAGRGALARDPNRVVLLSDIHISGDAGHVERGVNMTDHLRQAVSEVLANDATRSAGRAIVNGDCAFNNGEAGDYEQVLGLLRPLRESGMPVHLSLGNHDSRDRLAAAAPQRRRWMTDRRVMVIPGPLVDFVLLDSLDRTRSTPGILGHEQVEWLEGTLDDPRRAGKPTIVMVHHQPELASAAAEGYTAESKPKFEGLIDTPALMETLLPRKQVKMLIFGHTHMWAHGKVEGMHLVNIPAVAYVFRKGEPSAWTECAVKDGGATVTLHCLDKGHPANGEVVELGWRA